MENNIKVIILAAGQGTRLRPLTDNCPKCMVEVNSKSIIERQIETMCSCGIEEENITIISGYCGDVLKDKFRNTKINFIVNAEFETTNMVYSLMCAKDLIEKSDDVLISYGDIIYDATVLNKILVSEHDTSVVVDDDWYEYWSRRCENPLDDAETLMYDENNYLTEIGQKTDDIKKVQSQYIGLMRFRKAGLNAMLSIAAESERRTLEHKKLWSTDRTYENMYMTDLLQGMIEEGYKLHAIHINRGWYEIDDCEDLKIVEDNLKKQ